MQMAPMAMKNQRVLLYLRKPIGKMPTMTIVTPITAAAATNGPKAKETMRKTIENEIMVNHIIHLGICRQK
jgi:hypothetical protein